MQDAGAAAVTIHGRTAEQSYTGLADWELVARVADDLDIPVFGSGDCVEPEQITDRLRSGVSGVLVGRGVLRNPWILAQAERARARRDARVVTRGGRGQFLRDYLRLLLDERVGEEAGFRHVAPGHRKRRARAGARPRALGDQQAAGAVRLVHQGHRGRRGAARRRINTAGSLGQVLELIDQYFGPRSRRRARAPGRWHAGRRRPMTAPDPANPLARS